MNCPVCRGYGSVHCAPVVGGQVLWQKAVWRWCIACIVREYIDGTGRLPVSQCDSYAVTGGRCELDTGHDGPHFASWFDTDGGYTWTYESTAAEIKRHASRFD